MCDIELEEAEEVEPSEESAQTSSCFSQLHPPSLAPFEVYDVVGFNWYVGVRLFENNGKFFLMSAMGHIISILNIENRERKSICMHVSNIRKIEQDMNGRFIITCDKKCLIVWGLHCSEEEIMTVLRVYNKPMGALEIIAASISCCGKYILIVSEPDEADDYHIQFWLWSFGRKECNGEDRIKSSHGKINNIRFSQNDGEDFFAITMTHTVAFGYWDTENETLKLHIPETKRFNELNSSCYVTNTRYVVSGTTRGRLVVWSDLQFEIFNKPVSNIKNFVKSVPLRNCAINDVQMVDEYIASVDECGEIRFYDTEIRLIYHCQNWTFSPLYCLYPVPTPRKYKLVDVDYEESQEDSSDELIYISNCPKDYTMEAKPFIIRNFVITTTGGQVAYCDVIKNNFKFLTYSCEHIYVAADHHPTNNLITACSIAGRIVVFDYMEYKTISEYNIDYISNDETENKEKLKCTSLKMSQCGSFLGIGLSNGMFYLLEPITGRLIHTKPSHFTKAAVDIIVFGTKSRFLAYTDTNSTIVLITFEGTLSLIGKHRYHCQRIVAALLAKVDKRRKLITIGEDSFLVEYDVQKSIDQKEMVLERDVRLEQTAKITAAIFLPSSVLKKDSSENGSVIFTANNEYKFRIFDASSLECLCTVLGTLFESPIRHLIFCSATNLNAHPLLIVASNKTLGIALTPFDGNPFRYSGVIVHHKKILQIASAFNGKYIVVQGEGDYGGTIWEINNENILQHFESGGDGLAPFCTLLPGGKEGWLFREMQDFFYYMQLMNASVDSPEGYSIKDHMCLSNTIDFLRAIGYFPSEWEINNILSEVKRSTGYFSITPTKISFSDIVKLYLNHKPVDGYNIYDIIRSVSHIMNPLLANESEGPVEITDKFISMQQIINLLSQNAEAVSQHQAMLYIIELLGAPKELHMSQEGEVTEIIPETEILNMPTSFNIAAFCKTLLGIEVESSASGNLYSMFGDAVDPSEVEPNLANTTDNMTSLAKCLPEVDHDKEDDGEEEEDSEEEEEEEENAGELSQSENISLSSSRS